MKKIIFYVVLSFFLLTSCTPATEIESPKELETKSPEEVYLSFREACAVGDLATAESFLTPNAVSQIVESDACANYLHDGYEYIGLGDVQNLENPLPDSIEIVGNTAYLYWNIKPTRQVTLYLIEGEWKINKALILFDD